MFDTLLASHPIGAPSTRTVTAALIVHILLIAAAVSRTASPGPGMRPAARDTIRLELVEARSSLPRGDQAPPARPEMAIPEPPGVPDIPVHAPELQLPAFGFSPPGLGQSGPASPHLSSGEPRVSRDSLPSVFSTMEVDELPELVGDLNPDYPGALRRAGVSGLVQVQYVVGSDGRVDGPSIRVLTSSHPAFLLAALRAIRSSRFKPARRGGRPAAVLVQQTIRFSYR